MNYNTIVCGDCLDVMAGIELGTINLIYIDPPFGIDRDKEFGMKSWKENIQTPNRIDEILPIHPLDIGVRNYLRWIYERLVLMRDLLAEDGSIYVHCDWRVTTFIRCVLDEVFGQTSFRNEIIWKRTTSHSDANSFGSVHDSIWYFAKGKVKRNIVLQDYDEEYIEAYYRYEDPDGRKFMSGDLSGAGGGPPRHFGDKGEISPPPGRHWMFDQSGIDRAMRENRVYWTRNGVPRLKKYLDETEGMPASDLWADIQPLRSWHRQEATGYATQKPEALLERIVKASSNEGDLVADFFCGSGTTPVVALKLNRHFFACDISPVAVELANKRIDDYLNSAENISLNV